MRSIWFGLLGMPAPLPIPQAGAGLAVCVLIRLWCAARLVRAFLAWDRDERLLDAGRFV